MGGASPLLGEAEALARALDDRVRLGQVLAEMAQVRRMTADPDGAIAAGRQALELAVALGESALQMRKPLLSWGWHTHDMWRLRPGGRAASSGT